MKKLIPIFLLIACTSATIKEHTMHEIQQTTPSIHSFKMASIKGDTLDFSKFKGKKILVVNTASECGYTPQYEGLEKLYQQYKDKLVVVGVPSNDFGQQEPGTNEQIQTFCKARFGVTFPLTAKVDVVGDNTHPLYKWLTSKEQNGVLDATVKWNFNKFLLDENGVLLAYFGSKTEPMSDDIVKYLK